MAIMGLIHYVNRALTWEMIRKVSQRRPPCSLRPGSAPKEPPSSRCRPKPRLSLHPPLPRHSPACPPPSRRFCPRRTDISFRFSDPNQELQDRRHGKSPRHRPTTGRHGLLSTKLVQYLPTHNTGRYTRKIHPGENARIIQISRETILRLIILNQIPAFFARLIIPLLS